MNQHDYIITGAGASGLMLAYRMAEDSFFDDKSILIIDKERKSTNDRTWCFWEKGAGEWDELLTKSWDKIVFKSDHYKSEPEINPYHYKMIRSAGFYERLWKKIESRSNITFIEEEVLNISHKSEGASVLTESSEYYGKKVCNSIVFDQTYKQQKKFPVLRQHFIGWFIETKEDTFDDSKATFMDFSVNQKGNTRFMYILPISPKKALVEYTLFSTKILSDKEYESEILLYLKKKDIQNYQVLEKERGVIPMTCYKFWKYNSKNVLNIGTVGGWSKASTGYTFMNITKKTNKVLSFLKNDYSFTDFLGVTRFWWYDLLLLDILSKENHKGSKLFSTLFQKNSIHQIFKFLDEETHFFEELKIMWGMPSLKFTKVLLKRLF